MKTFLKAKVRIVSLLMPCILFCALLFFPSCKKKIEYFNYVSELRQNMFFAETDAFSLRVYAVEKEHPYTADGIPRERSQRAEFYLTAPLCDKNYTLTFYLGDEEYGGEFSFDNVKSEYYFSCTANLSALPSIRCIIGYDNIKSEIDVPSVLRGDELSARELLNCVRAENPDLFLSLTDKYGFAGEIYIRLIHEENNYYYLGIIERTGKIHAFLLNASTGKILAKRETN